MTQITEDYVSFEVAKMLREKGFDEPCKSFYGIKITDSTVSPVETTIKRVDDIQYRNQDEHIFLPWKSCVTLISIEAKKSSSPIRQVEQVYNVKIILAPTLQMTMKWLREVYNIYLQFEPYWAEGDMRNPCNWYWIWTSLKNIHEADRPSYGGKTYEEAVETALKYALENLI